MEAKVLAPLLEPAAEAEPDLLLFWKDIFICQIREDLGWYETK